MTQSDRGGTPPRRRRQGFWLTAGEVVGVVAVVIAGLNLWDSHQQRALDARREQERIHAATAFVAVGEADAEGRSLNLRPLKAEQAIQSVRLRFPSDVLDHPVDIAAARPRIESAWISAGLKRALETVHAAGAGETRLPVALDTVYVEDGDTHADSSLYQVGVAWKRGFLGGWEFRVLGLSLARRGLSGDTHVMLEQRWLTTRSTLDRRQSAPPPKAGEAR